MKMIIKMERRQILGPFMVNSTGFSNGLCVADGGGKGGNGTFIFLV